MKEGRNGFSVVLCCLVRNPAAWNSRERARAIALVAGSFRFVPMSFFFILASQPRGGWDSALALPMGQTSASRASWGFALQRVSHPWSHPGAWMLLETLLGIG